MKELDRVWRTEAVALKSWSSITSVHDPFHLEKIKRKWEAFESDAFENASLKLIAFIIKGFLFPFLLNEKKKED